MPQNFCNTCAHVRNVWPCEDGKHVSGKGQHTTFLTGNSRARIFALSFIDPSIFRTIRRRHNQEVMHALVQPPSLLILQLGRVLHTEQGTRKSRHTFHLSRHITIPTFTGYGSDVVGTRYQLCGGVVHSGNVVTAGHYHAFCFPDNDEDLWCIRSQPQAQMPANKLFSPMATCWPLAGLNAFEFQLGVVASQPTK